MKKLLLAAVIAVATLSANASTMIVPSQLVVKKTSVYLGTVTQGADVIQLYGDSATGIVDSVVIVQSDWPDFSVTYLQNVKIFNSIATGKIYTADANGSQRIIVLMNAPVY